MTKRSELDFDSLGQQFTSLLTSVCSEQFNYCSTILEFIEQELELGIKLSCQQELVLRLFYSLPLTVEQESILEYWRARGVCTDHPVDQRNILCLESGRRSGKTLLASIICAYEFYKLCQLANPQQHYGIAWNVQIAMLVIATSATQGERTIYSSVANLILGSPYFKSLIAKKHLTVTATKIIHHQKRLAIYSGNSKSASQVGGTLKALILDEVARFKDVDGNSNALELWSNLGAATLTFRNEAILLAISSAWYEGDAIQVLRQQNQTVPSAVTIQAASWDLNPIHASRDNPIIQMQYQTDPRKAALEYEGIRPAAEDPFLDVMEIKRALSPTSAIEVERQKTTLPDNSTLVTLMIRRLDAAPVGVKTALHLDPAVVRDGYALAFGHKDENLVIIDGILVWEPDHDSPVSFDNVEYTVRQIHRQRPLLQVTADHYASPQTLQRLKSMGIRAETVYYSARQQLQMYELVRQLLHQDRLRLPADSPWTTLMIRELSRLQLIKGTKINHPAGESKDIADAIAGVCWQLNGVEFCRASVVKPKMIQLSPSPLPTTVREQVLDDVRRQRQQRLKKVKESSGIQRTNAI